MKVSSISRDGKHDGWLIFCPGCECGHRFDERWTFNGNMEKPTFRASLLIEHHENPGYKPTLRCHSFVTNGKIEFLSDSEHELKGQTVDLPDL